MFKWMPHAIIRMALIINTSPYFISNSTCICAQLWYWLESPEIPVEFVLYKSKWWTYALENDQYPIDLVGSHRIISKGGLYNNHIKSYASCLAWHTTGVKPQLFCCLSHQWSGNIHIMHMKWHNMSSYGHIYLSCCVSQRSSYYRTYIYSYFEDIMFWNFHCVES